MEKEVKALKKNNESVTYKKGFLHGSSERNNKIIEDLKSQLKNKIAQSTAQSTAQTLTIQTQFDKTKKLESNSSLQIPKSTKNLRQQKQLL
jgi:hypothetical protein